QFERDRQVVAAIVRALRRHVEHVLDAVDLLLDRGRNRVADDGGAGTRIRARNLYSRRRDLGILRDRQRLDGGYAREDDHQRDNDPENGTVDEERSHVGLIERGMTNSTVDSWQWTVVVVASREKINCQLPTVYCLPSAVAFVIRRSALDPASCAVWLASASGFAPPPGRLRMSPGLGLTTDPGRTR